MARGTPTSDAVTPSATTEDTVQRKEPKSRYGNRPCYEVYGNRYEVMGSSYGYQERGVASWYGNKFHGRQTSSHERYDMYALTAAHKALPLPTYVRVKNLRNHKSVIVRVNDRGPFVANRIIDLSYSAALRLDMIRQGTSLVEVTAISFDEPPPPVARAPTEVKPEETKAIVPEKTEAVIYVQVGAFGDAENASRRFALLRSSGVGNAFVLEDNSQSPALYRVRIGPIVDVVQYDSLVARLQNLGISETHLVTE